MNDPLARLRSLLAGGQSAMPAGPGVVDSYGSRPFPAFPGYDRPLGAPLTPLPPSPPVSGSPYPGSSPVGGPTPAPWPGGGMEHFPTIQPGGTTQPSQPLVPRGLGGGTQSPYPTPPSGTYGQPNLNREAQQKFGAGGFGRLIADTMRMMTKSHHEQQQMDLVKQHLQLQQQHLRVQQQQQKMVTQQRQQQPGIGTAFPAPGDYRRRF